VPGRIGEITLPGRLVQARPKKTKGTAGHWQSPDDRPAHAAKQPDKPSLSETIRRHVERSIATESAKKDKQ
jgi:hypothetical protein